METAWSNWCHLESLAFFTDFLTEVSLKIQISTFVELSHISESPTYNPQILASSSTLECDGRQNVLFSLILQTSK